MASTLVKSVRISPELWAFLEDYARVRGKSPNAVLVSLVEELRPVAQAQRAAVRRSKTVVVAHPRNRPLAVVPPDPRMVAAEEMMQAVKDNPRLADLPLGPAPTKPGARLKKR